MATREDYAMLSAVAYNADRNQYNQLDFTLTRIKGVSFVFDLSQPLRLL